MRGRNEEQLAPLVEFAAERNLLLRFIELMPVSTSEVLEEGNFFPIRAAQRQLEARYGSLMPEPQFRTNGPATYYQIPGRAQRIGFIGAMTNLHFCESCNKLRLTCDGKMRPCLGSYLEFDIMKVMRAGASDAELEQFFLDVVERKPQQHDFRDNYQTEPQDGGDRRVSDGSALTRRRRRQRADGRCFGQADKRAGSNRRRTHYPPARNSRVDFREQDRQRKCPGDRADRRRPSGEANLTAHSALS